MTELNRAGEAGSLGHIDSTQRDFRQQIDALTDTVRQLGGNPAQGDPLTAPYVLYVNPYTGSDKFVGGSYTSDDDGTFDAKMRRIELQRLECGYTEARPFKTLSRAAIEAGIITSKAYLDINPAPCGDLISIVMAAGSHTILNDRGTDAGSISTWADGKEPTDAELYAFNDETTGGLILPRGCSVISLDLRKCILRPSYVPTPGEEASDYSNRRSIFKCTGGGYYFGFTILDKLNYNQSHHLLHVFEHSSQAELDTFYAKIKNAFKDAAGLSDTNTASRPSEYQIVGPLTTNPQPATDTVQSASPYIYNCSIRSTWGIGGIFADGSKVGGFRSMVVAQLTSVSLQRDMRAWEKYESKSWSPFTTSTDSTAQAAAYTAYISEDPNNVRSREGWHSFHVRAINKAILQEVSVFAIGQSRHHWCESGGELTITNSNSNFGGVAALAEGFRDEAQIFDKDWSADSLRRPLDPLVKDQKVERIQLGILQNYTSTTLTLANNLDPGLIDPNQPILLTDQGYSLKDGDYIWIDNPAGQDYRAKISGSTPWDGNNEITITGGLIPTPIDDIDLDPTLPDPVGFRVYIQRVKDVRSVNERRYSFLFAGLANNRLPIRDYVAQNDTGTWSRQYSAVTRSEVDQTIANGARVELRASKRPETDSGIQYYEYVSSRFYRKGDVIVRDSKHFAALRETTGTFNDSFWEETYVHMPESFLPEGNAANATPIIVFDKDTSGDYLDADGNVLPGKQTLFDNLGNETSDTEVEAQIISAVDYQGAYWQLRNWGRNDAQAKSDLLIQSFGNRDKDLTANSWSAEFRRPSNLRLYSHAFEWAGYHNYTKALPDYQQTLLPQNKFTFYFTNASGGKVYASGFNEEGFQVTPRGIEDLTTGEVLSVDDLGNPDRPIDVPTEFDNLSVSGQLTIEPGASIVGLPQANVTEQGIERKASSKDVDGTSRETQSINTKINASPMMTLESLNYWKDVNGIVTARDTRSIIYVDPVNGNDRTASQLIENAPFSRATRAKSIIETSKFINASFSSNERVELRLGPGYYLEKGQVRIECRCDVRAWDFNANGGRGAYLNTNEDGGTKPFMGVEQVAGERGKAWNQNRSYLTDGANHPIFPTESRVRWGYSPAQGRYEFDPLHFVFEQESTVTGVVWLGSAECITNTNIPDDFFSLSAPESGAYSIAQIRSDARSDSNIKNTLGYFVRAEINYRQQTESNAVWSNLSASSCIEFQNGGAVYNCTFDSICPSQQIPLGLRKDGLIAASRARITVRGVWVVGNAYVDSSLSGMPEYRGQSDYLFTGHHKTFVTGKAYDDVSEGLNISLGGSRETSGGAGADADYNYTWNNIHLVGINMQYRDNWNPTSPPAVTSDILDEDPSTTANPEAMGPSFKGFIGSVEKLAQHGLVWHSAFVQSDNHYQGVAGVFGSYTRDNGVLVKTKGFEAVQAGFTAIEWRRPYFLQKAATGKDQRPNVDVGQSANPGEVSPPEDFDLLNVQLTPIKKGIDVVEAVTVSRNVKI